MTTAVDADASQTCLFQGKAQSLQRFLTSINPIGGSDAVTPTCNTSLKRSTLRRDADTDRDLVSDRREGVRNLLLGRFRVSSWPKAAVGDIRERIDQDQGFTHRKTSGKQAKKKHLGR